MRYVAWTHAISLLLLGTSTAFAQGVGNPPYPSAPEATAASAPAPAPTAPAPVNTAATTPSAVVPSVQGVPAAGSCVLGIHGGIETPDAETALRLVCEELRRRAPSSASSYLVEIGRLGNTVILSVSEQDSSGQTLEHRQLRLGGIEETATAAPRLADALVNRKPIGSTQRADNLVEQEARTARKKSGDTHFGLGVAGAAYPGASSVVSPGIQLSLYHETGNFAFGGDLIGVVSPDNKSRQASFGSLSVGGRYFTSSAELSPYVGGGLAYSSISIKDSNFDGSNTGVGAYLEAGIEAFRASHSHLLFGVRANVPFYSTVDEGGYLSSYSAGSAPVRSEEKSKYSVPVTFNATVLF